MSQVKLVARTLDLFEFYASRGEPLSLTELSQGLNAPMSSTLALVRTLLNKGYLYQSRKRTYYPTKKLLKFCMSIDAVDPVLGLLHPYIEQLRNDTDETVVLGTREDLHVVYLDLEHSTQAIRYTAELGEMRSLHANSLGKALLTTLSEQDLRDVLKRMEMNAFTEKTRISPESLYADLDQSRSRGWSSNVGESVPDLAAIAAPISIAENWYAISVVGPIGRMQANWDRHVTALTTTIGAVKQDQDCDLPIT